ncbi:unnamed protein product [Gongylonema pulchrum]|uniref:Cadherin domain-containing protein n=1 Tax=Gongylonema pulchrum TaxID=637853 RepID=A0A3P7RG68_9BILA|nr:unnamed protein product [Gongylonema pulchrum]
MLKAEALDRDTGENGRVHYVLHGERTAHPFCINQETGEVTLCQKPLEIESGWKLKIQALDSGWPMPRSSEILISVYVNGTNVPSKTWPSLLREPENEHAPVFATLPTLRAAADASPETIVGRVEAFDSDAGYAGLLRYGSTDKFFAVQPFSGEIFVLGALSDLFSSENKTRYVEHIVEVSACDWGQAMKCTNGSMKILLSATNIHKPYFEKHHYRVRIAEDTAIGTEILALSAQDDDYGENGMIGYQLLGEHNQFTVNQSTALSAQDDDYGENGMIGYQLLGEHNQFSVNQSTGILKVSGKLDRELKASHRFTVMAFDHGQPMKAAFVNVTVVLVDVNDNAPQFAVMAFDHGQPMKVAFVNVTVVLVDVNDNAPQCAETVHTVCNILPGSFVKRRR